MKPSEGLSEDLVQAVVGLDEKMQLVEAGQVECVVGLLATFYFLNGGEPAIRANLIRAFECYTASVGSALV